MKTYFLQIVAQKLKLFWQMKYLKNKVVYKVHTKLKMIWSMEENIGHLLMEIKLFGMKVTLQIDGKLDFPVIVDLAWQPYLQLMILVVPPKKG